MTPTIKLNRRNFLRAGAASAAGLWIGFYLPERSKLDAQFGGPPASSAPNAYIHIGADDSVTFIIAKGEMGQGTVTSLSQLLAEELECDWKTVRTEFAPVDAKLYGGFQGTVGSSSVRSSWGPLRQAGASAREMLVQAAAQKWGVDKSPCRAQDGAVVNTATNARLSYGSLAEAAGKLPVPQNVALKDPKQFQIIGKPVKRLDTPGKVNGSATFGIDVRVPGMLYAVVQRCPVFRGKAASFDASKAKAVPGVKNVVQISSGVAVVATDTWTAMQGRRALKVSWDEGPNASVNTPGISRLFAELVQKPGATARKEGDAEAGMAGAAKKVEAVYEVPFLAHATMEPLNCVARVRADSCEVWAATQMATLTRDTAVKVTGLKPEQVQVHSMLMGGGFGRRGGSDFVSDAVEVSKAIGAPVKVTWSREDDMQHDTYRPASHASFAGGLDAAGWPVAWTTKIACPSFGGLRNGVDGSAVQGLADLVYGIPNILVDYRVAETGIPVFYWRSVGYSQNTWFAESFLDELAAAGGKDPVELRRRLLTGGKYPRLLNVLNIAAERAGWGNPLPAGRARGVALANNVGSFNAQIAEISVDRQGKVRVHRMVCAMDCGQVVNPAIVTQQIQGAMVYGLTAALKGGITIDRGRVQQANFNQYDVLRMDEMPVVEVHIVPSSAPPSGIGEAGLPAAAPAVTNAIFAATGKRIRRLPINPQELV
jgi:isoquinoline 1-oxidoreductase beta subunit